MRWRGATCISWKDRICPSFLVLMSKLVIIPTLPPLPYWFDCINHDFFVLLWFYEYLPNHSKIRIFKKIYQGDPQNPRVREIRLSSVRPSLSDHLCWRPSLLEGDVRRTSTHFIRNCTGFCRIPPLRWVSACQRTGLTGLSTAAKGGQDSPAMAV